MRGVSPVVRVSCCTDSGKTPETVRKTCPRLLPVEVGQTAWRREWDSNPRTGGGHSGSWIRVSGSSNPMAAAFSGSPRTESPGPRSSSAPRTTRSTSCRLAEPRGSRRENGHRGREAWGATNSPRTCRLGRGPLGLTQAPVQNPTQSGRRPRQARGVRPNRSTR